MIGTYRVNKERLEYRAETLSYYPTPVPTAAAPKKRNPGMELR
jgi:hypothetical protein